LLLLLAWGSCCPGYLRHVFTGNDHSLNRDAVIILAIIEEVALLPVERGGVVLARRRPPARLWRPLVRFERIVGHHAGFGGIWPPSLGKSVRVTGSAGEGWRNSDRLHVVIIVACHPKGTVF
jgi:hypothetical protein